MKISTFKSFSSLSSHPKHQNHTSSFKQTKYQENIAKIRAHEIEPISLGNAYVDDGVSHLMPFLTVNKALNQVVNRLKTTPDYLEQIAEEKKQKAQQKLDSSSKPIIAIKARHAYFDEILTQALKQSQKNQVQV